MLAVHRGLRRPARMVVAGALRARVHVDRWRSQRGGDGLAAARSGAASCSTSGWARRGVAARQRGRSRGARRSVGRCVALVARAGRRPRRVRDQLPAVHRVGRRDLGHHEHPGEPAADGLLAELPRRRVRRAAAAVLRRERRAPVLAGSSWSPRCSCRGSRSPGSSGRGAGATRRSSCCSCSSGCS